MSGGACEVVMATVGRLQILQREILAMWRGEAVCLLVGLNEQSIGVNHQATADQLAIISVGSSHNADAEENAERQ